MHIPYTAEFINRNQRIELALKAYATVFAFAYKTALRLQKFGPEPVFRWDPFQGANIWYFLRQ